MKTRVWDKDRVTGDRGKQEWNTYEKSDKSSLTFQVASQTLDFTSTLTKDEQKPLNTDIHMDVGHTRYGWRSELKGFASACYSAKN